MLFIFNKLKDFLTPPVFEDNRKTQVAAWLTIILLFALGAAVLMLMTLFLFLGISTISTQITLAVIIAIFGLLLLIRQGYIHLATHALIIGILGITTLSAYNFGGVHSTAVVGYFLLLVITGLLLNNARSVIIYAVLSLLALFFLTYAGMNDWVVFYIPNEPIIELVQLVLGLSLVSVVVLLALHSLNQAFDNLRQHEAVLASRNEELQSVKTSLEDYVAELEQTQATLRKTRDELEMRVIERTAELAEANAILKQQISERKELEAHVQKSLKRRAHQVQTSTEVAQRIAAAPALADLFQRVVHLVQERFGYYHAHVYTLEDEYLVMQEGTGLAGRMMKETDHRIPLMATKSLVARAARTGEPILVSDVSKEAGWLPNALLPETKSEIAVPIKLGQRTIGVLDVQNDRIESLKEEDQILLMGLCGQIAVAINNRWLEAQRKQAEDNLKRYARELERSNRALQDFASVASHDLQEPLRKIRTFGDRLKTKYEASLDERGQDYLSRMQNAAARMQILINDLLTYARVTSKAQPFIPISLNEVLEGVLSDLEVRIEQVDGQVTVAELPTIEADPTQMRQLLQNLIGNALKFHRPDEPALVNVDATLLSGSQNANELCQIKVRDNGIGFDEKYLDRIFGVFQRLHGRQAYEGTGVGLAVCLKIVERHSGTITAKSNPGEGTTFIVTLPVKQPQGGTLDHEKT